jgi:hypothetical protein
LEAVSNLGRDFAESLSSLDTPMPLLSQRLTTKVNNYGEIEYVPIE